MPQKKIKDQAASTRAKLLNYAKNTDENYNAVLLRFFQERFLARLGLSKYKSHFVLKGGFLLLTKHINAFRPTIDIDILGVGIDKDPDTLKVCIKEIADLHLADGVQFDANDIKY